MRLEQLHLVNFGRFTEHSILIPPGQVIVFFGPNEAGKSTLQAFIRAILFGFPAQYSAQHYPSLSRGAGGRITLCDGDGMAYTVERFAGITNSLRVIAIDGPVSDAATVLRHLTGGATLDSFKTIFAFSLDELQEATQLNDSNIYNAGQGTSRLPTLKKSLEGQRRDIYRPTGTKQEIPRLVKEIQSVDHQLRAVADNAGRYGALTARRSEIDVELRDADAELGRLSSQRAEIQNLLNGWDDWVALSNCEMQLRDMPRYVDFPENPIVRLDSLEERTRLFREERDESAGQLRRAEEAVSVEIPGEDLLYDAASIEAIRRGRSSYDNSIHDLPERQGELRGLEADFERNLVDLGHHWGEAELQAFDASLVVRNQVNAWKKRTDETGESARQTQQQLDQERRSLQEHQSETQEAREKVPPAPPWDAAALAERQDALRAARGRLGEYERQRQLHESLRSQLNAVSASREEPPAATGRRSTPLVIALSLVGIILLAAGIPLGGGALILGIVGWLVALAGAVALWYSGRPATSGRPSPMALGLETQTKEAEKDAEATRQSLLQSAAALGLDGQPDTAALDSAEARLDDARNSLDAWNAAKGRLEEAVRREKSQEQRVEAAALGRQAAQAAAQGAQEEWRQWLRQRGLNETLTPDMMTAFVPSVETARSSLSQARQMRDRVSAIEKDIREFREQVEPLAARHGLPLDSGDQRQLARVADELIQSLEETQLAFSDRERSREQMEETRRLLESRERRLQSAEEELAALLAAGGAEDAEDFRRRARQHEERLDLERRRDEHRRNLERLSGPGERFDAYRDGLATSDPNLLGEESARFSERHDEVDDRRNALREELGGIDTELAQLTNEEESSALRIRRSTLEEQLREHAREWSRLTIAEALLDKTRQKFEQERQPSVIRHAQDFFSGVTGQRYQRLYAPIGQQTITVTDATGAGKQPAELSRGTREQLYLALRFGLIREFGEHAERLPVVVDEALVNFDPERARLAAESFSQLAETNQVLVFTCHPATAEMFADAAGAHVVDIGG